jgi:potassium/hydrogen antiporter
MVVLVAAGALIGPSVLGLVSNPLSGVGAQLLFNIGVALILFHGGTGISLRVISGTAVGLGLLVLPGVLLTALIVALVVSSVFGVAFPVALLVGTVLAATDPAILIPLFDRPKLHPKVSQTVIAESAFNDVTGTVLTLTLVGAVEAGGFTFSGPALEFTQELLLEALIGVFAGAILCYAVASLLLTRGVEGAEIAVSMVALAVCVTLLLQATTGQATSPSVSAC